MQNDQLLKNEERAVIALRALYQSYGYLPYKMSRFEEYELYARNKDFLLSDRVITFTDTNGRLMALKPDVTLSILQKGEENPGCKRKVCYNENVYRVSRRSGQFKEIMQTGLECIGDVDGYDVSEVVALAARSLGLIGPEYVLEISHLGVVSALLDAAGGDEEFRRGALEALSQKNAHDLTRLCAEKGVAPEWAEQLAALVGIYGPLGPALEQLRSRFGALAGPAIDELEQLAGLLKAEQPEGRVVLDFSVVNHMDYYNGIVFRGFLQGVSQSVLAGGQYDRLMRRMGRGQGAVGFALYLDRLEQLRTPGPQWDVQVLLLYEPGTPPAAVAAAVQRLRAEGKSVSAQKAVPPKLRYQECVRLDKEGKPC